MDEVKKKKINNLWFDTEIYEIMKLCGKENPTEKDEEKFLELQDKIARKSPGYYPDLVGVLYRQELKKIAKKMANLLGSDEELHKYYETLDKDIQLGLYNTRFYTDILSLSTKNLGKFSGNLSTDKQKSKSSMKFKDFNTL